MKTLRTKLIVALTLFALTFGCKKDEPKTQTKDFKFEFSSFGGPVEGDQICGEAPWVFFQQEGEGTGTLLGKLEFFSQFCNNVATGEFYSHKDGNIIFTAANGDKLFLGKEGEGSQIFPSDHPDYDLEFTGNPLIVGGTGRFEGATGSAMIESYVDLAAQRTDHVWAGTITLKK